MSETTAATAAHSDLPLDPSPDPVLLTSTVGRVRLVTLNRPKQANAFSSVLYRQAAGAFDEAAADDGIGALVLTGAGRSFCAGTDLVEMAAQAKALADGEGTGAAGGSDLNAFNEFMDALVRFPKPLIAAVNGSGVGLGLTMLAHFDLVLVSDQARLLAPFTAMGVAPEAASSYLLPRRMGRQRASLALLASEWISAEEAVATGLALRSCPPESLLDETLALATTIAERPLASVLATTRLIRDAERAGITRARAAESEAFRVLMQRPDLGSRIMGRLGG